MINNCNDLYLSSLNVLENIDGKFHSYYSEDKDETIVELSNEVVDRVIEDYKNSTIDFLTNENEKDYDYALMMCRELVELDKLKQGKIKRFYMW